MGLEVDGGVGPQTIERCRSAGANLMVAGSAIYDQPSPGEAWKALTALARRVNERDAELLDRALDLAERGRRSASPNPIVGCVIARDGRVLGEGWHERRGQPHAERDRARRLQRAASRRDGLRLARAVQPSRPPAALRRCADRGRHRARRLRHPRSEPRGRRPGARAPAGGRDRGRAGRRAHEARARRQNAALPDAHRPPAAVRAAQAGRDAGRAHRHEQRARAAGSRRPRAAGSCTTGARSWTRSPSAAARRSPTTPSCCRATPSLRPSACRCAWCSTAAAGSRAGSRLAQSRRDGAGRCAWRPPGAPPPPAGRGGAGGRDRWRRRSAPLGGARGHLAAARGRSGARRRLAARGPRRRARAVPRAAPDRRRRPAAARPARRRRARHAPRLLETSVREVGPDVLIEGLLQPLP